jgi:predicted nuclease of predicted toxin-antitoxin system
MAVLFADENVPITVVRELRVLGHDVVTAYEAGRANQAIPDDEVLKYATAAGRAVLTNNRHDFHKLHAAYPGHAGIVTFTDDRDTKALAVRIHQATLDATLTGRLIKIVRPG